MRDLEDPLIYLTKLKLWKNFNCDSNCDKTQIMQLKLWPNKKLKLWQNSKTRLWQNSKTQIVTKLKLWQISIFDKKYFKTGLLVRTFDTLTTYEMFSEQLFAILAMFSTLIIFYLKSFFFFYCFRRQLWNLTKGIVVTGML